MRDLKHFPNDLRRWVKRSKEEMKQDMGEKALEMSQTHAPEDRGFLRQQGELYVDGQKTADLGRPSSGHRRVSMESEGGYDSDITIVYKAGRPSKKHGVFDYARYVGLVNPAHLKKAKTKEWIETALNPNNKELEVIAYKTLREEWKRLQK